MTRPRKHFTAAIVKHSVNGVKSDATYKDGWECFHDHVDVTSSAPFCLRPIVLESGPYAGLRALVFAPASHFPFERLPPELRQMVYKQVFHTNGPIRLTELCTTFKANLPRREDHRQAGVLAFSGQLLRVNKAITQEATEFLYTDQDFVFDELRTFVYFLRRLTFQKRWLTHITVERSHKNHLKECYTDLQELPRLETFKMPFSTSPKHTLIEHAKVHWDCLKICLLAKGANRTEASMRLGKISFLIAENQHNVRDDSGKVLRDLTPQHIRTCKDGIERLLDEYFECKQRVKQVLRG